MKVLDYGGKVFHLPGRNTHWPLCGVDLRLPHYREVPIIEVAKPAVCRSCERIAEARS